MTSLLFDGVLCSNLATKHTSPTRNPYTPSPSSKASAKTKNPSSSKAQRHLNPLPTVTSINVSHRNITPCALFTGVQHLATQYVLELNFAGNTLPTDRWSLPEFLDKVSCVFPNLQHLHVTVDKTNAAGSCYGGSQDEDDMEDCGYNEHAPFSRGTTMANSVIVDLGCLQGQPLPNNDTNSMSSDEFYLRLYILYRMPDLKSINGVPVTTYEQTLARPTCPSGVPISYLQDWIPSTDETGCSDVARRESCMEEHETEGPSIDGATVDDCISRTSSMMQPKPLLLKPKENVLVIGDAQRPTHQVDHADAALTLPPSPLFVPGLEGFSDSISNPVVRETASSTTRRSLSSPFPLSFQKRVSPSPISTSSLAPRNETKRSPRSSPLFQLSYQEECHTSTGKLHRACEESTFLSVAASTSYFHLISGPEYSFAPVQDLLEAENDRLEKIPNLKGDARSSLCVDTQCDSTRPPNQRETVVAKHGFKVPASGRSKSPECSRHLGLSADKAARSSKGSKKKSVTFRLSETNVAVAAEPLPFEFGRRTKSLPTIRSSLATQKYPPSLTECDMHHVGTGNTLNITPLSSSERMRRKREKWRKRQKFSRTKTLTESVLGDESNSSCDEKDSFAC